MADIVERLREKYDEWNNPPSTEVPAGANIVLAAAAEIERLRSSLILIRRAIEHLPAESIISKIDGLAKTALERKDD